MADRKVANLLVSMRAELGGLKTDIRELETTFKGGFQDIQNSAASAFSTIGKHIAGAFTVRAIFNFGKSVVDLAGQLQDLQDQTGISAQLLSGMKSTIEESGGSLEGFAKAIFTAQKNLGEIKTSTDPAAIAVKSLGLNLDELRNASPEKFLELLAAAMAKPENASRRAADGAALLGKQFQILNPIIGQMAGRLEEFRAKGMNPETIKILDDFGDSITELSNSLQVITAGPLAGFVALLKELFGLTSNKDKLIDELNDVSTKSLGIAANLAVVEARRAQGLKAGISTDERYNALLKTRDDLLERSAQITARLNQQPVKPAQTPFRVPDATSGAASKATTKDTSSDDFIAGLRKQADALKISIKETTQGAAAAKDYGLELEFAAFKAKLLADNKPIPPDLARQFLAAKNALGELTRELADAKFEAEGFAEAAKRDSQDSAEWLNFAADVGKVTLAAQDARKAFDDMRVAALGAALDQDSEELGRMGQEAAQFSEKFKSEQFEKDWQDIESVIRSATGAIGTAFNGVIQGTQSVGQAFANMGQSIALSMANAATEILIVQPLIAGLKKSLQEVGNAASAASSSGGGIFASILGAVLKAAAAAFGGRGIPEIATASGGIFSKPTLRLIGEAGPEAVVPLSRMRGGFGGSQPPNVTVKILGDIIPQRANMTKDQVVQIGIEQFNNRGAWTQTYENRRSRD